MLDLIINRRSIRKFKDTKVSQEELNNILKAALLAPSSRNKKPLEFIVVENREILNKLEKCKTPGSIALKTAPVAIIVLGNKDISDVWIEDASISATFIQLEIEALNLGSCWIQIRNRNGENKNSEEMVREALNLPNNYGILSIIALGHKDQEMPPHTEKDIDFSKVRVIS
ncbi:MAG: nitroreductase family protein [Clostridium sp.]